MDQNKIKQAIRLIDDATSNLDRASDLGIAMNFLARAQLNAASDLLQAELKPQVFTYDQYDQLILALLSGNSEGYDENTIYEFVKLAEGAAIDFTFLSMIFDGKLVPYYEDGELYMKGKEAARC
jgi:hypothetical protein